MNALALLLAAVAASPTQERPKHPPATLPAVRTELVQLDVLVTDRDGRFVTGIDPTEFEILEDGKPQTLSHFAEETRASLGVDLSSTTRFARTS